MVVHQELSKPLPNPEDREVRRAIIHHTILKEGSETLDIGGDISDCDSQYYSLPSCLNLLQRLPGLGLGFDASRLQHPESRVGDHVREDVRPVDVGFDHLLSYELKRLDDQLGIAYL